MFEAVKVGADLFDQFGMAPSVCELSNVVKIVQIRIHQVLRQHYTCQLVLSKKNLFDINISRLMLGLGFMCPTTNKPKTLSIVIFLNVDTCHLSYFVVYTCHLPTALLFLLSVIVIVVSCCHKHCHEQ